MRTYIFKDGDRVKTNGCLKAGTIKAIEYIHGPLLGVMIDNKMIFAE